MRLVSISENKKLEAFLEKSLLDVIESMKSGESDVVEKVGFFLYLPTLMNAGPLVLLPF